ncbi:MAG: TonB-dependent receptor domain-containing protein, partial [Candidatus Fonsibacter sp.]
LGWIHDLPDGTQIYANAARAFRAPDTNEIYRLQGSQNVADLGSERAVSYELGLRGVLQDLNYAVALYDMDKENIFEGSYGSVSNTYINLVLVMVFSYWYIVRPPWTYVICTWQWYSA